MTGEFFWEGGTNKSPSLTLDQSNTLERVALEDERREKKKMVIGFLCVTILI